LRSLIVWLLLLALPYQGMAAASMLACAPQPLPAQAMHRMHAAPVPPCHQEAAAPGARDEGQQTPHGGSVKCASCAACAIFAALLPASVPDLACHAPAASAHAFAAGGLPSVCLAQPERPPRPRLA
jgi:hypothetical protein